MLQQLRTIGLKITPQRIAIVRELADDGSHPTAQELFERLRGDMPTMSFATVYNTLGALAAAGLCVARSLAPGATRFDPNGVPHHHAVCDRCGRISDVPAEAARARASTLTGAPAKSRERRPAVPEGFEVRAVEQIYRGVCGICRR